MKCILTHSTFKLKFIAVSVTFWPQSYQVSTFKGPEFPQHRISTTKIHCICGVSKKFSEWYQNTNKTGDTNKLTTLDFNIIAILHNTLLTMFIKLLETVTRSWIAATSAKRAPFMMLFRRGNRKKSTQCNPLIWRPQAPDQGITTSLDTSRPFTIFYRLLLN
jgi:hypothetical protein